MPKDHLRIIEASSESQPRPTPAAPRWSVVLRALREARGLTQDGWAARLGYGRATIQRWERGEAVPNADAVEALVKLCREEGLLRTFARGPLQGVDLSAELLRELLAGARQAAAPRPGPEETVAALLTTVEAGSGFHLPPQLTSFLGRERELDELAALLSSSRLLTPVGPPGVGKTRLAVEGARGRRGLSGRRLLRSTRAVERPSPGAPGHRPAPRRFRGWEAPSRRGPHHLASAEDPAPGARQFRARPRGGHRGAGPARGLPGGTGGRDQSDAAAGARRAAAAGGSPAGPGGAAGHAGRGAGDVRGSACFHPRRCSSACQASGFGF